MPSPYERRLVLFYVSNVVSRLRGRDDEAPHLAQWLQLHEEELGFRYPRSPDDVVEGATQRRSRDREVPTLEWQRLGDDLRNTVAAASPARPDRTARRVTRLAKATRLSRTDTAILELVLRHQTGSLVGSLIEEIGEVREWNRRGFRVGNPMLPCLLGLSSGKVYSRFAPDAPLVTSGLMSIDDDGDVTILDRLTRLHWLPQEAGSDVQRLLLDEAGAGELHWSDFDHIASDRDHLEPLLSHKF